MKKFLAIFGVFALLLPVLAGCQSAYAAQHETNAEAITPEQAVQIALQDAGLTRQEIHDPEVELDKDRGVLHYDVDFEKNGRDYDYEIDAYTGQILKKKVPTPAPTTPPTVPAPVPTTPTVAPTVPATPAKQLTGQEAMDIALADAGLTREQVRELEAGLDRDWGVTHYEVEFESGGYEYEYKIHPETGEILRAQKERD